MILHLLALIGTTLIVVRGTIFRPVQRLYPPLFRCSQCIGMWVGILAGATGIVSTNHSLVVNAFVIGAATSFLSLLADAVLSKLLD